MIHTLYTVLGDSLDPDRNLALEQTLMETVAPGVCILYLWQNQQTVVIGRNQNAWRECRVQALEADGGHLARRLSGGGAVYHDLGNLNFTFLVQKADYDLSRQLEVVIQACRLLNIPAERSGRNDVLSGGRKFSGNAFYDSGSQAYHHGTLLVDVDMAALSRYLNPSSAKLKAKGVPSVRARVVNLAALCPGLTIDRMKDAMLQAFGLVYGLTPRPLEAAAADPGRMAALETRNRSWEWRYGVKLPFSCACEGRFDWGELRLELQVDRGQITGVQVWSDAMDWAFVAPLRQAITGCRFAPEAISAALGAVPGCPAADACGLLCKELFDV